MDGEENRDDKRKQEHERKNTTGSMKRQRGMREKNTTTFSLLVLFSSWKIGCDFLLLSVSKILATNVDKEKTMRIFGCRG